MRLAKYNLYWYIGCIIYQSNWSGPFSLVVMTSALEFGDCGSRPGQVKSFYLQVYISPPTTHSYTLYLNPGQVGLSQLGLCSLIISS